MYDKAFWSRKYQEGETTPSEYLKKKIIYEFDKTRLQEIKKELYILKKQIIHKSKYDPN